MNHWLPFTRLIQALIELMGNYSARESKTTPEDDPAVGVSRLWHLGRWPRSSLRRRPYFQPTAETFAVLNLYESMIVFVAFMSDKLLDCGVNMCLHNGLWEMLLCFTLVSIRTFSSLVTSWWAGGVNGQSVVDIKHILMTFTVFNHCQLLQIVWICIN